METKTLQFLGLAKKEEILFKSFLNLLKNDLDYKIEVIEGERDLVDIGHTGSETDDAAPDILLIDDAFKLDQAPSWYAYLPKIEVGDVFRDDDSGYLARPVQWSEFKTAMSELTFDSQAATKKAALAITSSLEQALEEVESSIESETSLEPSSTSVSEGLGYEYELDNLTIDYDSFTNSEYFKVVDDVRQFQGDDKSGDQQPVLLVTDDESGFENSVLVIETEVIEAWDMESEEFNNTPDDGDGATLFDGSSDELEDNTQPKEQRVGIEIKPEEPFWEKECEIIADNQTFLIIQPDQELVYSQIEPGKWAKYLSGLPLLRAPLVEDWKPSDNLKPYPISSLKWVNTLVYSRTELDTPFTDVELYQLDSWPEFHLLELDNILLKICTMLFVRPESVKSLAAKSGYGRSTIRGLMNACYESGSLKPPEDISGEQIVADTAGDEGMLGRLKDVFR